jgi:trk system potassium uptake protein TrkH
MSPFDAVSHSFSTVAIGGFSTHDQSMGYFEQPAVHIVAMVFMLLAGMNFALHFLTIRSGNIRHYLRDTEVRVYLGLILVIGVLCLLVLMSFRSYPDLGSLVRHGLFQVISIGTTTGFTTSGFAWWPVFLPVLLVLLACVGGCAGSTAGGMKVIRAVLLYKQGHREFQRLVHPHALMSVKISGRPVQKDIIDAVWAFFSVYTACYLMLSLAVTATGLDLVSAFSAVASCINNLGPGLGEVAENYAAVSDAGKWLLAATMLLGRLELFTLLVLFTPTFWRG